MPPKNSSDAQWFATHVQVHESMLRAWLQSHFPSEPDLDDLVQEALLRVWQAHQRGAVQSPKAYLFTTARHLALDRLRRRSVVRMDALVPEEVQFVIDDSESIPDALVHQQELALLTEAIQSLPERCRQVFTLRKIYGLPQKEIAARLGISEHTVSAQLTIGLHKCTEYLTRQRKERE